MRSTRGLVVTLIAGLAVAALLNFGAISLGRAWLDVPDGLASLSTSSLIAATVFPVIGNCFGYLMSFRRPSRYSLTLFLGVGAVMTAIGVLLSMSKLPASANAGSVATTLMISVLPVLVIVPALLRLRRRAAAPPLATEHDRSAKRRLPFPDGTEYRVTRTTAETNGDAFEMELALVAHAQTPPPHAHPRQREDFEVLEGAFEIWLDGEWQRLHAGQRATAQPAQAHTFRSCGHSARVKMTISPALSFEQYIHRVHTLLSCGKLKGPKDPVGLMYLSMLFQEHRDTVAGASSPQRAAMAILASIGRAARLTLPPPPR
jgi:quercetin dioxygenase-like cupin family protein